MSLILSERANKLLRFSCVFFAVLFCFLWFIQPMEAYAVATEIALTWVIFGLFTACGLTATTIAAVNNQNSLTDFRAGSLSNYRLIDYKRDFWNDASASVKSALNRLASQVTEGVRYLGNTYQNRQDLDTVLPAVQEFVADRFELYSLDDWADASPKEYGIDQSFYDGSSVGLGDVTITQNHVNGIFVPTSVTSFPTFTTILGSFGVYDDAASMYLGSSSDFKPYVDSVLNQGYSECVIHLYQALGYDFQIKVSHNRSTGFYSLSLVTPEKTFTNTQFWYDNSSGAAWSLRVLLDSSNRAVLYFYKKSDSYWSCTCAADSLLSQLFTFAYNSYNSQNPTYTVYGTGALALEEPVQLTQLISFPSPPPPDDEDDEPDPLIYFPPFPKREDPETEEEVEITSDDELTWNDLSVFTQTEGMTGYPDQQPIVDPDLPVNPDSPSQPLPEISTGVTLPSALEVPWHYVRETLSYIGDFFELLGNVLAFMPQPILYCGLAVVVLSITFGLLHRFLS